MWSHKSRAWVLLPINRTEAMTPLYELFTASLGVFPSRTEIKALA